jgi:hypothetical protein
MTVVDTKTLGETCSFIVDGTLPLPLIASRHVAQATATRAARADRCSSSTGVRLVRRSADERRHCHRVLVRVSSVVSTCSLWSSVLHAVTRADIALGTARDHEQGQRTNARRSVRLSTRCVRAGDEISVDLSFDAFKTRSQSSEIDLRVARSVQSEEETVVVVLHFVMQLSEYHPASIYERFISLFFGEPFPRLTCISCCSPMFYRRLVET